MKINPHSGTDTKPVKIAVRPSLDPVEQLRQRCKNLNILIDWRDCVTRASACLAIGVSKSTLDRYVDRGDLVMEYRVSGQPRFTLQALADVWVPQ